jgi:hypothetical protein
MQTKKDRNGENGHIIPEKSRFKKPEISRPDEASFRGSIVNKEKAGLLTCNIHIILPGQ